MDSANCLPVATRTIDSNPHFAGWDSDLAESRVEDSTGNSNESARILLYEMTNIIEHQNTGIHCHGEQVSSYS